MSPRAAQKAARLVGALVETKEPHSVENLAVLMAEHLVENSAVSKAVHLVAPTAKTKVESLAASKAAQSAVLSEPRWVERRADKMVAQKVDH